MRLLVTGGSGYVGSEVLAAARERGWDATGTYRTRAAHGLVQLDVRDAVAVRAAVAAARPDVVVHTAYVQEGPEARETIVDGTANVARAAQTARARLIHLSTDLVFCGRCRPAYAEADDPCPVNAYGRAKADAELAVAALTVDSAVVRTSLVYGGRTPGHHERLVFDALRRRRPIAFFSDELRSPVAAGDLAAALLALCRRRTLDLPRGRIHLGGADTVSRYELAVLLAEAYGLDPARLRVATSADSGVQRPLNCALDSGHARRQLRLRLRGARRVLRPGSLVG
ncbi:MAG: NAD(P)-dependent oxidoreductase [Gaiellaceae bacterium]